MAKNWRCDKISKIFNKDSLKVNMVLQSIKIKQLEIYS